MNFVQVLLGVKVGRVDVHSWNIFRLLLFNSLQSLEGQRFENDVLDNIVVKLGVSDILQGYVAAKLRPAVFVELL